MPPFTLDLLQVPSASPCDSGVAHKLCHSGRTVLEIEETGSYRAGGSC